MHDNLNRYWQLICTSLKWNRVNTSCQWYPRCGMTPGNKTWTANKWCKGGIHGQSDNTSSSPTHYYKDACTLVSIILAHVYHTVSCQTILMLLHGLLFISTANQALISYIRVLSYGCANLYHTLNEIFLQPQLTPCREHRQCSTVSLASVHTSNRTCQLNNHGTSRVIHREVCADPVDQFGLYLAQHNTKLSQNYKQNIKPQPPHHP